MDVQEKLLQDEGYRPCVYQDSLGFWTIGVGVCVDDRVPGAGLTKDEVVWLLAGRIARARAALLAALPWVAELADARSGALIEMAYQMGNHGLLGFHNTLTAAQAGDFETAANQMLASNWAQQTPARAKRLAEQMRSGAWA
jgi:lysozyme